MESLNNGGASCMHSLKYLIIFNKKGICVCDVQLKKFLLNTAAMEEESSNKYDVFRGIFDFNRFRTSNVML